MRLLDKRGLEDVDTSLAEHLTESRRRRIEPP
jgi:hypothetical protein